MNPILVVLPYHRGDFDIAKKLVQWISELGSCKPHSILLCADSTVPQESMRELMELARPSFERVATMIVTVPTKPAEGSERVWPPNTMFLQAANQVRENYRLPFLWLEPDAIPITDTWLDQIALAYQHCPRRFMGTIVTQVGQPGLPAQYLNGVAVYPNDAVEVFNNISAVKDHSSAFDIGSAPVVVSKSQNTSLMQHFWGTKEMPPIFVATKTTDSPKNHVTMDFVKPGVVLFHRSKDGNLIDLLREQKAKVIPLTESSPDGSKVPEGTKSTSPELTDEPGKSTEEKTTTPPPAAAKVEGKKKA